MSSIDHLHSETKMLLVEDHLNLLSAQYLVHCLDTENGCHHITTMDHPPREMKETLFTRHNQTVLPLLAYTKKESLQAIHTSFVNTTIDNMTEALNDTAYKRWSCHSGLKLLCKLCRTSPSRFTVFLGMPAMRTRWMAGAVAHKSG